MPCITVPAKNLTTIYKSLGYQVGHAGLDFFIVLISYSPLTDSSLIFMIYTLTTRHLLVILYKYYKRYKTIWSVCRKYRKLHNTHGEVRSPSWPWRPWSAVRAPCPWEEARRSQSAGACPGWSRRTCRCRGILDCGHILWRTPAWHGDVSKSSHWKVYQVSPVLIRVENSALLAHGLGVSDGFSDPL